MIFPMNEKNFQSTRFKDEKPLITFVNFGDLSMGLCNKTTSVQQEETLRGFHSQQCGSGSQKNKTINGKRYRCRHRHRPSGKRAYSWKRSAFARSLARSVIVFFRWLL